MGNQQRNINPHKHAKAAMWLFGSRYAEFNGGSMDFWDSLTESEKRKCRVMVKDIEDAQPDCN